MSKIKLPISPGLWLLYWGIIYAIVGFSTIHFGWLPIEYIQMAFCLALSLPLWIPPLSKWVGVKLFWRKE
jgi:hypothetical protein